MLSILFISISASFLKLFLIYISKLYQIQRSISFKTSRYVLYCHGIRNLPQMERDRHQMGFYVSAGYNCLAILELQKICEFLTLLTNKPIFIFFSYKSHLSKCVGLLLSPWFCFSNFLQDLYFMEILNCREGKISLACSCCYTLFTTE